MCALRASIRHRDTLIRSRSAHGQPRQNALHLLHGQVTHVLSDIPGVTGLQSIRAIVQGERDPHTRARMVSHLRTYRQDYVDPGADHYEAKYRDRTIRTLQRKARQRGLDLVPVTTHP